MGWPGAHRSLDVSGAMGMSHCFLLTQSLRQPQGTWSGTTNKSLHRAQSWRFLWATNEEIWRLFTPGIDQRDYDRIWGKFTWKWKLEKKHEAEGHWLSPISCHMWRVISFIPELPSSTKISKHPTDRLLEPARWYKNWSAWPEFDRPIH